MMIIVNQKKKRNRNVMNSSLRGEIIITTVIFRHTEISSRVREVYISSVTHNGALNSLSSVATVTTTPRRRREEFTNFNFSKSERRGRNLIAFLLSIALLTRRCYPENQFTRSRISLMPFTPTFQMKQHDEWWWLPGEKQRERPERIGWNWRMYRKKGS